MNNENGIFSLIYNNIKLVYEALIKVLKSSSSFEIVNEEPAVHAIHVMAGKSFFSQGNLVIISLEQIDDNKTKIHTTMDAKVGVADKAKYNDMIQQLIDKVKAILPPPVMEEAPKPDNMVQKGELIGQMGGFQANTKSEPMSLNKLVEETPSTELPSSNNTSQNESNYQYEPKPIDYESLKENESSKHKDNDPLQDLMKNI